MLFFLIKEKIMERKAYVLNHQQAKSLMLLLCGFVVCSLFFTESALAVTVAELAAPIRGLKTQIFGGWMMAVKIVAAAIGLIFSLVRGSLAPAGLGVGLAIGIHFFSAWLGDGAAGALI
jgi:hypothetical protein